VTDNLAWNGPESLESYWDGLAERARQTASGEAHFFTIVLERTGESDGEAIPLGTATIRPDVEGFRASIGLWIGEPYQGQGYGTQTIALLLQYGFEQLGLEKIESWVFTGNQASRRAHEKNAFSLEGTVRAALRKRGRAVDEWLFGITREDYLQAQAEPAKIAAVREGVLHITSQQAWQAALSAGEYRAPSLEEQGFIHASRPDQVLQTANHYYPNQSDLVLLWIDPRRLQAELRWEPSDGDLYPHIYGPINLDAVSDVRVFLPDEDGVFRRIPFFRTE
jgi:uncharacterized protein (DUF952 family)/RimJ/RimL family protein N-acetyltransferase